MHLQAHSGAEAVVLMNGAEVHIPRLASYENNSTLW